MMEQNHISSTFNSARTTINSTFESDYSCSKVDFTITKAPQCGETDFSILCKENNKPFYRLQIAVDRWMPIPEDTAALDDLIANSNIIKKTFHVPVYSTVRNHLHLHLPKTVAILDPVYGYNNGIDAREDAIKKRIAILHTKHA